MGTAGSRTGETTGRIETHGEGMGAPTPDTIEQRAQEIAATEGRTPQDVTGEDRDRAIRELLAPTPPATEVRTDLQRSSDPADPAVETGHKIENRTPPDEQRQVEQEVEEGVREAEHERMARGGLREDGP